MRADGETEDGQRKVSPKAARTRCLGEDGVLANSGFVLADVALAGGASRGEAKEDRKGTETKKTLTSEALFGGTKLVGGWPVIINFRSESELGKRLSRLTRLGSTMRSGPRLDSTALLCAPW
jgi:hypothetical protein